MFASADVAIPIGYRGFACSDTHQTNSLVSHSWLNFFNRKDHHHDHKRRLYCKNETPA